MAWVRMLRRISHAERVTGKQEGTELLLVSRQSVRNLGHHFPEARFWRASGSPTRRPNEAIILGVVAVPKSYRARVDIDLCGDFNEVAFRVTHHRFVVSVSSYPRTLSYGPSGCAHGSY